MSSPPRFVWVAVVVVALTAFLVGVLAYDRAHKLCESRADSRRELRGALVFLVDLADPEGDNPNAIAYRAYLNENLPPIDC